MTTKQDYTPGGTKIEGAYENDRNAENNQLFKDIIREAFGVTDVIVAHHLVYETQEVRGGFAYQIVEEIPSADALIFDHLIAQRIWGGSYKDVLVKLALEPCETRDALLKILYYGRKNQQTKSQILADIAKQLGIPCVNIPINTMSPEDLSGIPAPEEEKMQKYSASFKNRNIEFEARDYHEAKCIGALKLGTGEQNPDLTVTCVVSRCYSSKENKD